MAGEAYNEQQGIDFQQDVMASYAEAQHDLDLSNVVWSNRMTYDAATTLGYAASRRKHLAELRRQLGLSPFPGVEAPIAPREYSGNMCGVRVPGVQSVPGGAGDSSLVLSWFYDRYSPEDRTRIRDVWTSRGYWDVLLGWPDSRDANGATPESFRATCLELVQYGFRPCVMLLSKGFDAGLSTQEFIERINVIAPYLCQPRAASRVCIGWELGIEYNGRQWITPTQVQEVTDAVVGQFLAVGIKTYVHFQPGYPHLAAEPPGFFSTYWNKQVGKLTGLLHQADAHWSLQEMQSRYNDILVRFNGAAGTVSDSGFGHPFDCIALELTAEPQFNGQMSEADGDRIGRAALASPPAGDVRVMGSGNGS